MEASARHDIMPRASSIGRGAQVKVAPVDKRLDNALTAWSMQGELAVGGSHDKAWMVILSLV